jgi:hypothetical protein
MTANGTPANFVLTTDPILANAGEPTEDHFELVFIFGYIGQVTDDTVGLHQGLDLRRYYEIPRQAIVYAEKVSSTDGPSTKLVLFSTTRITYVSIIGTATLPVSSLAAVVGAMNRGGVLPVIPCPAGCGLGTCRCTNPDYWFHLNEETARRLEVVVARAPTSAK